MRKFIEIFITAALTLGAIALCIYVGFYWNNPIFVPSVKPLQEDSYPKRGESKLGRFKDPKTGAICYWITGSSNAISCVIE